MKSTATGRPSRDQVVKRAASVHADPPDVRGRLDQGLNDNTATPGSVPTKLWNGTW